MDPHPLTLKESVSPPRHSKEPCCKYFIVSSSTAANYRNQRTKWQEGFPFSPNSALLPGVEELFGVCSLPFANSRIREEGRKKKNHLPFLPPSGQSLPSLPFEPGGRKSILARETPDLRRVGRDLMRHFAAGPALNMTTTMLK